MGSWPGETRTELVPWWESVQFVRELRDDAFYDSGRNAGQQWGKCRSKAGRKSASSNWVAVETEAVPIDVISGTCRSFDRQPALPSSTLDTAWLPRSLAVSARYLLATKMTPVMQENYSAVALEARGRAPTNLKLWGATMEVLWVGMILDRYPALAPYCADDDPSAASLSGFLHYDFSARFIIPHRIPHLSLLPLPAPRTHNAPVSRSAPFMKERSQHR
ncbi:hypothetical protein B0H14DRAFT_2623631 [Mycena olivaceomarginata]|nr:hypothetical protein B0H14DRAFT_2623631 [Mycena olivaceomarginata]